MKKIITIAAMLLFITTVSAQTNNVVSKPFSNYTEYKGLVFVSGQIGNTDAGFSEEIHQALQNVSAMLKQAGTSMKKVLNVTVYLRNIQQIDEFNSIYRTYFQPPYPARTCIAVSDLVRKANVEISVVAAK
ncbi:RidA family protein [Niastella sp. OAS944]|uniref:RidA family protein n=1 Tax=Niastella sp. OAS944 TaxID=2664089 RepID=UPI00348BC548|nr:2-iminobutanoate/2-iminopropanoate deaminase [Chitinophagaceae bacterium OAS944]